MPGDRKTKKGQPYFERAIAWKCIQLYSKTAVVVSADSVLAAILYRTSLKVDRTCSYICETFDIRFFQV